MFNQVILNKSIRNEGVKWRIRDDLSTSRKTERQGDRETVRMGVTEWQRLRGTVQFPNHGSFVV